MLNVTVSIPVARIVPKVIKGSVGEFTLYGVAVGTKFVRLVLPKDTVLPTAGNVEGNLFARKYESKTTKAEFDEIAIYVTNPVKVESKSTRVDLSDVEADAK